MSTHTEYGYGFFHGGDPRKFHPDGEGTTAKEWENHRRDCAKWDEAELRGVKLPDEPNPSGFVTDDKGEIIGRVTRSSYGLGTYEYEVEDEDPATPAQPSLGNAGSNAGTL